MKEKTFKQTFLLLVLMLSYTLGETELIGIEATVEPSTVNAQNTKLRMFGSIRTTLVEDDYFLITLPQ